MLLKLVGASALVFTLSAFQSKENINDQSSFQSISKTVDAEIEWQSESISLGDISKGVPVDIKFQFTNVGKTPVIVSDVKAGCGCTSVDFPEQAIAPGKTSFVTAIYNAKTPGKFKKSISVSSNASALPYNLTFNGVVRP